MTCLRDRGQVTFTSNMISAQFEFFQLADAKYQEGHYLRRGDILSFRPSYMAVAQQVVVGVDGFTPGLSH